MPANRILIHTLHICKSISCSTELTTKLFCNRKIGVAPVNCRYLLHQNCFKFYYEVDEFVDAVISSTDTDFSTKFVTWFGNRWCSRRTCHINAISSLAHIFIYLSIVAPAYPCAVHIRRGAIIIKYALFSHSVSMLVSEVTSKIVSKLFPF